MAVLALGVLGAAAGAGASAAATGAVVGWAVSLGWTIGIVAGQTLFGPGTPDPTHTRREIEGPRIGDTTFKGGSYGQPIPKVWGSDRVAGGVIWMRDLVERAETSSDSDSEGGGGGGGGGGKGGKGGGGGGAGGATSTTTITQYSYFGTFAVQICEGPIQVRKIWANGKLIRDPLAGVYDSEQFYTIYNGTANQLPDPTMEGFEGPGLVPAYRHTAYIVFKDLPLKDFGNQVPNIEVEVIQVQEEPPKHTVVKDYDKTSGSTGYTANFARFVEGNGLWLISEPQYDYLPPTDIRAKIYRTRVDIDTEVLLFEDDLEVLLGLPPPPSGEDPANTIRYFHNSPYVLWTYGTFNDRIPPKWEAEGINFVGEVRILNVQTGLLEENLLIPVGGTSYRPANGSLRKQNLVLAYNDPNIAYVTYIPTSFAQERIFYFEHNLDASWASTQIEKFIIDDSDGHGFILSRDGATWYLSTYAAGSDIGIRQTIPGMPASVVAHQALIHNRRLFVPATNNPAQPAYHCFNVGFDGTCTPLATGVVLGPPGKDGSHFFTRFGESDVLINSGTWLAFRDNFFGQIGDIVRETCEDCGLLPTQIDVSLLTLTVLGYTRSGKMTGRALLEALQRILAFDVVESAGILKFVPQHDNSGNTGVTVPADDLGAHMRGSETPSIATLARGQELEMPRAVEVVYKNPLQAYDVGIAKVENPAAGSRDVVTLELPAVLDDSAAKNTARRFMNQADYSRVNITWSMSTRHLALEPSDIIILQTRDAGYRVRITEIDFTIPSILTCRGQITDTRIYDTDETQAPPVSPPIVEPIVPSTTQYLDLPILRNADAPQEGHYNIAWALGIEDWRGATLYYSAGGGAWLIGTLWSADRAADRGRVVNNPLPAVSHPWLWDDTTQLEVFMDEGTLSSSTDLEVQASTGAG